MISRLYRSASLSFDRFIVRESFADLFPQTDFQDYDAFVRHPGTCIKAEPRTQVRLVELGTGDTVTTNQARFVVKEYHYPLLPRIRTWLRHSKAEHEYRTLLAVRNLGIGAAEPVAFGVRRTVLGFVRSCFIITRYVEDSCPLEQWMREGDELGKTQAEQNWSVGDALAQIFRNLHQRGWFLFTAKPRNILLHRTNNTPEVIIIDLPYALRISKRPLARWAQALDLAVFLGNIGRISAKDSHGHFYDAYLPDPLGAPREHIERRVLAAIRWRRNQTPVSSLVHTVRSATKKWQRQRRKREMDFLARLKSLLVLIKLSHLSDGGDLSATISLLETVL